MNPHPGEILVKARASERGADGSMVLWSPVLSGFVKRLELCTSQTFRSKHKGVRAFRGVRVHILPIYKKETFGFKSIKIV